MSKIIFVLSITGFFTLLFQWGFRKLPGENWQFIAAVPSMRMAGNSWRAINLTYYGFFNASACVFSCAMVILLMSSIAASVRSTLLIVGLLLIVCYAAAKLVARIVEGKKHTFTVAGASFVGFLVLPWMIQVFNVLSPSKTNEVPTVQFLAAVSIAYAFGEAFGRLACISFGCRYGKLIWHAPRLIQQLVVGTCFHFRGTTKKVAYEAGLHGMPLIPIQAVTAIFSASAGVIGLCLFLASEWTSAAIVTIGVTQIWRAVSETLRADYRGEGKISAYQVMAVVSILYSSVVLIYMSSPITQPANLMLGLATLSAGSTILLLETLWLAVFIYLGRSTVTGANLSFHIIRDRT